jgi:hypothetical protein
MIIRVENPEPTWDRKELPLTVGFPKLNAAVQALNVKLGALEMAILTVLNSDAHQHQTDVTRLLVECPSPQAENVAASGNAFLGSLEMVFRKEYAEMEAAIYALKVEIVNSQIYAQAAANLLNEKPWEQ